jgi:hypothetical protein
MAIRGEIQMGTGKRDKRTRISIHNIKYVFKRWLVEASA